MIFPSAFVSRIQQQLGADAEVFLEALSLKPAVSLRLNPAKPISSTHFPSFSSIVPWCNNGMYLDERPPFTLDPLFHAGAYYVQESASMFLKDIFNQLQLRQKKLIVLDACAAPGGKSTHLASLISEESLLVSNETIASRVPVLKENIIKWGTGNVIITNNDPSTFAGESHRELFDVIVVDAPCSGEGLFRKDRAAIKEWSEENCTHCVSRQQRILASLLPALKSEGILIYCTCTFNPYENENNVKWLIQEYEMESIQLTIPDEWKISKTATGGAFTYSFYPHLTKSEGLFISVLQKKNSENETANLEKHFSKRQQSTIVPLAKNKFPEVREMVNINGAELLTNNNMIYRFPIQWINLLEQLSQSLNIKYAGTPIAEIKNQDLIPQHSLAMSIYLNRDYFPTLSLSYEEALKYLRKENIISDQTIKGWLLAEYERLPLGWLKSIGSRMNNYYPVEWRIRKQ